MNKIFFVFICGSISVFGQSRITDSPNKTTPNPSTIYSFLYNIFQQSPAKLLISLVKASTPIVRNYYPKPHFSPIPLKEYDFIIVGAGSAGSALASRLTENRKFTVLVLEAGDAESLLTDIPLTPHLFQGTEYDWAYKIEPQVESAFVDGKRAWPRGKGIGGSSIINYMIYTRGHKWDWDRIAAAGNAGWAWKDVFPYFYKLEKANLGTLMNGLYHNPDGLLSVEFPRYRSPITQQFMEAGEELNMVNDDYNDGEPKGFSYVQGHCLKGHRNSAARAYLYPFKYRLNLDIIPNSYVTRINIDDTKTARSVQYESHNMSFTVRAKKEIILCAGAINSPKLLMLSGIGPKQHLQEMDIPVIQDLNVGRLLYDHPSFFGLAFLVNRTGLTVVESKIVENPGYFVQWLDQGLGPYTVLGGIEGLAYIKTNVSKETSFYPDIELMFASTCISADTGTYRTAMNMDDKFFQKVYGKVVQKPCWGLFPMLLHPKSKGYVKLRDNNPHTYPEIFYDYTHPEDIETLLEAVKFAIKVSKTKAFQKYGSKLHDTPFPGCTGFRFGSDNYWRCALKMFTSTTYHPSGTCKMGPRSDPESVVDSELIVHNINGLRVCDASIVPISLSGHMNAPTIMIAEQLADVIKLEYF